ncbi:integrase catalytic domain-containing protein [Trichonephila inaurata madagascariensis]|uniref:Integrase catalytic domain-containing protein n=1 Tax=Trichonephila inaurata madagascariensis TaxID=2747483 RepID=A0A8X6IRC5_9ARAC|nr:integrase catalytic domain-containing protein [Trichonephila inaurata madagascariensis]
MVNRLTSQEPGNLTKGYDLQAFESPTSFSRTRRQVQFQLSSIWDKSRVNVVAFESSNRYALHPSSPTDVSRFAKSNRMKLADPDDSLSSLPIEILIGADFCWNVMHSNALVKLSDSLAMVQSSFGWILSGSRSHATVSFNPTVHNINVDTSIQELDNVVRNFRNFGIQPIQEKLRLSTHNAELLTNFHQSFKIIEGRRVVHLPWKPEVQLSSSNYDTAVQRFNSWTRIHPNTELKQTYSKQMQDYIDKKQKKVEDVLKDTQNEVHLFYLPYHVVKKITNEEIKWRIVFNASSHSPGHPSLSDALKAGPNLLPDILAMLLRFRLSKIAITSDGSQAFLQLILADEDRDATRFLWYKMEYTSDGKLCIADEIVTYRFMRLPFGITSSPFLLSASLLKLATMYRQTYPIATKHIENNTYMHDFVMGTSTDTEAVILYREILRLTSHISLPLAK